LRCRHYIDSAVGRASELVLQMNLNELLMSMQGMAKNSRDWKVFFNAARPRIISHIRELQVPHLILVLRISRDLRHMPDFIDLHAHMSTELMMKADTLTLSEGAQCLMSCTYSPQYRAQAQGLVRAVEQKWSRTEDLSSLRVVEIVDSLDTIASWGMKPVPLLDRLSNILVENMVELKYAGNVSLWITATHAFARLEHRDASWPPQALELSRDKFFLEKNSFFQHCKIVTALMKLRLFDEIVYNNIAELLLSDMELFKEVTDLSPVLWGYTMAGYNHEALFDACYSLMLRWMDEEKLDLSKVFVKNSVCQAVWCFAVAGYHKRYDSFAALLDYAMFSMEGVAPGVMPPFTRRLAQISDIVLQEAPELAEKCQYPQHLATVRTSQQVRTVLEREAPNEPAFLNELSSALRELGWAFDPCFMPDSDSAFYVDISLEKQLGKKVGFLVTSRSQLMRRSNGLNSGEAPLPPQETGQLGLQRRLLEARGWQLTTVDAEEWSRQQSLEAKRAFFEAAVNRAIAA